MYQIRLPQLIKWCDQCGDQYLVSAGVARGGKCLKYCSHDCSHLAARRHLVARFMDELFYFNTATGKYTNARRTLHEAVWCAAHGVDRVPRNHDVHHSDKNPLNNHPMNLELLTHREHTTEHNSSHGTEIGWVICLFCGLRISRPAREVRRGQNKFCSRSCAMRHRGALKAVGADK